METPVSSRRRVRTGLFEIDFGSGEIHKDGRKVQLQEQPFRVLAILLECPGEVVTREQLQERLWSADTYVGFDEGLNTAIRKLRVAFGDSAENPRFIETVSRRGYRFIAPVETEQIRSPSPPTTDVGAKPRPISLKTYWMGLAIVVFAVFALTFFLRTAVNRKPPLGKIMLVVLPLENFTGDSQQDYLADGITEEIIAQLGSLDPQHLGVIARTSAMRYKHTQKSAAQISREVGANYLLEGSIRHSGDRIRVTAQLIQSSDQSHLWADSYDRELSDVLKIESDIAGSVASEIRLTLSQQIHQRLAAAGRTNVEAHDAYLRGLQGWNLRTRDGFQQAITNFTRATELDPGYAPAFAGLSRVYSLAPIFAGMPAGEAAPKALEAASKALSLDETLADAHCALGFVKGHYEYDWPAAEREFHRAIELEPNNAYAHLFYSNSYFSPLGRHEEAIAEIGRAMALDPLSPHIQSFAGVTFKWARRYNDSLTQFQKVNQIDPNFPLNHERLAQLCAILGRYDEAITEETKARLLAGEKPQDVLTKMNTLQRELTTKGERGYWQEQLEFARDHQNPPEAYVRPYGLAIIYAHLGEKAKAFENLENALAERDTQITELAIEPQFDVLRSDARFADLERRIGLLPR
ncbi:MAG TPA: winged helix-turn-helix domain-containing protein [Candidatus Sulfotelmatobacter sp.]|nr:winged helix-turn-helix domain-containing protein [Candidatus Sulfotelmatobacter sp.]